MESDKFIFVGNGGKEPGVDQQLPFGVKSGNQLFFTGEERIAIDGHDELPKGARFRLSPDIEPIFGNFIEAHLILGGRTASFAQSCARSTPRVRRIIDIRFNRRSPTPHHLPLTIGTYPASGKTIYLSS